MNNDLQLLDVVALTEDLPEEGLQRGQVGTIVEELAPDVYEVEFSDSSGKAYAMPALRADQLLPLHFGATGCIDVALIGEVPLSSHQLHTRTRLGGVLKFTAVMGAARRKAVKIEPR